MQILARTYSSAEYPLANYMLIEIDQETAAKLVRWHGMALAIDQGDKDFLRMEFSDYSCDAYEILPDIMAEHEDALADMGYVVLPELDADQSKALEEESKRRDFSLVQVEAHCDIPSLNGFRWEFGVKHASHSVESEMLPLELVKKVADGELG